MAEGKEKPDASKEEPAPKETVPADPLVIKDEKITELTDDLKRLQADFENYKKRVDRECGERVKAANYRLIANLLPILDSFDKALEDSRNPGKPEDVGKGLEGLQRQLIQALEREGLRQIRTDGRFDPFVHEAMLREERDDLEDDMILEVYQKGYSVHQKTIRPARVKVSKRKAPEPEAPKEDATQCNDTHNREATQSDDQTKR